MCQAITYAKKRGRHRLPHTRRVTPARKCGMPSDVSTASRATISSRMDCLGCESASWENPPSSVVDCWEALDVLEALEMRAEALESLAEALDILRRAPSRSSCAQSLTELGVPVD
mmetsp:Transcript_41159/g.88458  ORF Transcript_41159/g.88458 Transcript_41159/m.88458 type:complete len:115 (+) Transcript_41159:468-812(+)